MKIIDENVFLVNQLNDAEGKLYGPFLCCEKYKYFNKNGKIMYIPDCKDKSEKVYATVDDFEILVDIIYFGEQLYHILKNYIMHIDLTHKRPNLIDDNYFRLVSEKGIIDNFEQIKPICDNFFKKYGNPIITDSFYPQDYNFHIGFPISVVINHILLIYSLHVIFDKESSGYEEYKEIYHAFGINQKHDNNNIFNRVINYINMFSLPSYNLSSFYVELIKTDFDKVVPISTTYNMFAFAFSSLQNNIATCTFYQYDDILEEQYFCCYKKCKNCLNTFYIEKFTDSKQFKNNITKTPKIRQIYCEDCQKKLKHKASVKYEKSIRKIYDELKSNIDKCNPKLANEIRNLLPKDKETKSHLMELYNQYKNDSK